MRFSNLFVALSVPFLVLAAPVPQQFSDNDVLVLKFANVLEQLETEFYTQALAKFKEEDFTTSGFSIANIPISTFQVIQKDEDAHTKVLAALLAGANQEPLSTCQFSFDSALTDVTTMAVVARIVEQVGVGAYNGAAHLLDNKDLLTAAGSILAIEARHQALLNIFSGVGTAVPQPFDLSLAPNEVLTLAGPFITGCDLGVAANPILKLTNTDVPAIGTLLTFDLTGIEGATHCQMLIGGAEKSISLAIDQCVVPAEINGPVAVYLTSDDVPIHGNSNSRFPIPENIKAGPALAFIDSSPNELGAIVRKVPGAQPITSVKTITPDEAGDVIKSASATAGGYGAGGSYGAYGASTKTLAGGHEAATKAAGGHEAPTKAAGGYEAPTMTAGGYEAPTKAAGGYEAPAMTGYGAASKSAGGSDAPPTMESNGYGAASASASSASDSSPASEAPAESPTIAGASAPSSTTSGSASASASAPSFTPAAASLPTTGPVRVIGWSSVPASASPTP